MLVIPREDIWFFRNFAPFLLTPRVKNEGHTGTHGFVQEVATLLGAGQDIPEMEKYVYVNDENLGEAIDRLFQSVFNSQREIPDRVTKGFSVVSKWSILLSYVWKVCFDSLWKISYATNEYARDRSNSSLPLAIREDGPATTEEKHRIVREHFFKIISEDPESMQIVLSDRGGRDDGASSSQVSQQQLQLMEGQLQSQSGIIAGQESAIQEYRSKMAGAEEFVLYVRNTLMTILGLPNNSANLPPEPLEAVRLMFNSIAENMEQMKNNIRQYQLSLEAPAENRERPSQYLPIESGRGPRTQRAIEHKPVEHRLVEKVIQHTDGKQELVRERSIALIRSDPVQRPITSSSSTGSLDSRTSPSPSRSSKKMLIARSPMNQSLKDRPNVLQTIRDSNRESWLEKRGTLQRSIRMESDDASSVDESSDDEPSELPAITNQSYY